MLYGIYGGYSERTALPSNRRRPSPVYVSIWRPVIRDGIGDALVGRTAAVAHFQSFDHPYCEPVSCDSEREVQ